MSIKPLPDLASTCGVLPATSEAAPAGGRPSAAPAALRFLRRALPSRGCPARQLELDFRPVARTRGPAPPVPPAPDVPAGEED